jgi:undecaprenyl-diphosphatase
MLATLIAVLGPPWSIPIIILWAPLVALARVAMGVHYISDVLAGGVLGLITGSTWLILFT